MTKIVYDFLNGKDVVDYADTIDSAKEKAKVFVTDNPKCRATIYSNEKEALKIYGTSRYCIFA